MFKKIRKEITELKNDFFEATVESECRVLNMFNVLVHFTISILIWSIGLMFYIIFNLKTVSVIIGLLSVIYIIIACFTNFFKVTWRLSYKLLFKLFGRYGKVVSKEDWKNIKKHWPKDAYKEAISKKSRGYCYFYSWAIAQHLSNAKLMYCAMTLRDGPTAHAVIVKDNCVYDTNNRRHHNYDEYIKRYNIIVYKMFSEKEYKTETFFDDIRPEFVEWCAKNNVYCKPQ